VSHIQNIGGAASPDIFFLIFNLGSLREMHIPTEMWHLIRRRLISLYFFQGDAASFPTVSSDKKFFVVFSLGSENCSRYIIQGGDFESELGFPRNLISGSGINRNRVLRKIAPDRLLEAGSLNMESVFR
jgi:hypothetical protein